jgi:non-homologous end joining protein Ku
MASRACWSGQLRLSLVSISRQVVPATKSAAITRFHSQNHKPSGSRVRYQKVVPGIGPVKTGDELMERKSRTFDAAAFKESYEEALRELIEAKAEHRQVREIEEPRQGATVINVMNALKRSVGKDGKERGERKTKTRRAKATARGSRRKTA